MFNLGRILNKLGLFVVVCCLKVSLVFTYGLSNRKEIDTNDLGGLV